VHELEEANSAEIVGEDEAEEVNMPRITLG